MSNLEEWMVIALEEAKKAMLDNEVPIGAIIVKDNKVIAKGYNQKEKYNNSLYHAEMIAINAACKELGTCYLDDCEMYVTFEPCVMCTGALLNCRIKKIVFGCYDMRFLSLETIINQSDKKLFNYTPIVIGGVLEKECSLLISDYFKKKRKDK